MADTIVSVRMPSSLVQRLKLLSKENHFLDLSEEIRSIVKIKTREYKQKNNLEPKDNISPTDFKTENIIKEELVKRLRDMIKELEKND